MPIRGGSVDIYNFFSSTVHHSIFMKFTPCIEDFAGFRMHSLKFRCDYPNAGYELISEAIKAQMGVSGGAALGVSTALSKPSATGV